MIVAGIMSGTSADGIDVALARITPTQTTPKIAFLGHQAFPYPRPIRAALLRVMSGDPITAPDLSRLHWRLGTLYAEAAEQTALTINLKPDLIGLHGQTIYHQPTPAKYLGAQVRATTQIGEPAILRERLNIPVVSDFRPADLAAGGQGAPLVPMLDLCLFRHPRRHRILLNLGGIANLTLLPAAATQDQVIAFDTGPANMVIDALMHLAFRKPYDREGRTAATGRILPRILTQLLKNPYFRAAPPKSCGREQFGTPYAERLRTLCLAAGGTDADAIRTATELTAATILQACLALLPPGQTELIAAGGGTRNTFLMARLRTLFTPHNIPLTTTDDHGIPSQAKEAVAFALLAWLTFHRLPGNLPSATGATAPRILGRITPAPPEPSRRKA